MIKVSRLNNQEFYINPNLIEVMEETPDTVLTLTTDKKLIVKEKAAEIIERIIKYNRKIYLEKSRIE
ncbi:MAG: flagellar FlbD family protein [Spirochaetia bacterium]|nr:flagellar FlbD family protein [Spirochaetia bacterium]